MGKYLQIKKMWDSFDIKTTEELNKRLDNYRILFAYNSGRIENDEVTFHDTREIFENGKIINFTGSPGSIFETQNQKTCYEYLLDKIIAKESLSIKLIKEVHAILTAGTYDERRFIVNEERPGEFKKHDYIVGKNEVGYPPQMVEEALKVLVEEMNGYEGEDILKAAAYFHLKFEYAHPFADGNGRVGRTLMNYFLLTHNNPPIIIYEEDKDKYYKALDTYDNDEDIMPMYEFLEKQTVKTWEKTLEREYGKSEKKEKKFDDFSR